MQPITDEMVLAQLKESTTPIALRIPSSLEAKLVIRAKQLGVTKSALVTAVLKAYLERE